MIMQKILSTFFLFVQPTFSTSLITDKKVLEIDDRNISEIIKENNFGNIKEPDQEKILDILKEKYNNLDLTKIKITHLNYQSFEIDPADNSDYYSGFKIIKYNAILNSNFQWSSKEIRVDSYSKYKHDDDSAKYEYKVKMGVSAFLSTYNSVKIKWKAETWNNADGNRYYSPDKEGYNKDTGVSTISNKNDYAFGWSDFKLPTNISNHNNHQVVQRVYDHTNYAKDYGFFDLYFENNNTFCINFSINIEAHAKWFNAYYARTSEHMIIDDIEFA